MRKISEIIIHCTATSEGRPHTVAEIDNWHRQRGWRSIGYHYLVYLDGSIHPGRDENEIGAHCRGHNSNSIGIAYVGGVDTQGNPKDTRTPCQRSALKSLVQSLKNRFPNATVYTHSQLASTSCPSFNIQDL